VAVAHKPQAAQAAHQLAVQVAYLLQVEQPQQTPHQVAAVVVTQTTVVLAVQALFTLGSKYERNIFRTSH
jgi:hypothetical protein